MFTGEPSVRYRTTTVRALSALSRPAAWEKLQDIVRNNCEALLESLRVCGRLGIRAFRVQSQLLPIATHPDYRYGLGDLPDDTAAILVQAGDEAKAGGIRLSFHPDQFVLLGSPDEAVTEAALRDLDLHGELSELLGADAINLHVGGAYGDKQATLDRVARNLDRLTPATRQRLTIENDDRLYTVADLAPLCQKEGVPLCYDVHHHRCNPDGLTVAEATALARKTWDREPLFHVSSPAGGWEAANPRVHADFIEPADFPEEWCGQKLTVDVEARAKEKAVLALATALAIS